MTTVKNVVYEVPRAEVIALKSEGVICKSNVNICLALPTQMDWLQKMAQMLPCHLFKAVKKP
jgi:hypothetical protein